MAALADRVRSPGICLAIATVACAAAVLLPWWSVLGIVALLPIGTVIVKLRAHPQGWVLGFLTAAILLPPLPLPGGDTGVHPSILAAGAGILLGIARLSEWRLSFHPLNVSFGLVLTAGAISLGAAAVHSGLAIATASAARVGLLGLGVFVFASTSQGPDRLTPARAVNAVRFLFWVALAAALFACLDFVFQFPAPSTFEPQFLWLDSGVYRRAQGLFYEASTLGNFSLFLLMMCAVDLTRPLSRRILPQYARAAGIVTFSLALLLSFSRASVLAGAIGFGTLAILERRRWFQYRRPIVALLLLIPLAALVFSVLVPEVASGYWARVGMSFDRLLDSPDRVLSGRLESWRTLLAFAGGQPWGTLWGIGYKTLPYTEYLGRPVIADNMYLSMLIETGVLGLTSLLALNAAILSVSWRALRAGSFFGKWMFCFWCGEVFQMLSGDILTYWRVLPFYFFVLALAMIDAETPVG